MWQYLYTGQELTLHLTGRAGDFCIARILGFDWHPINILTWPPLDCQT
jgi:hypothetical protein